MGAGHDQGGHGHGAGGHDHTAGANATMLKYALALTAAFLFAEVVGAYWFNSLALLSDAAHMLTDVSSLAIALVAIRIGDRPPDDKRTFGYKRFEILAAAFNALLLFAVAIYIAIEAVGRFRDPEPVESTGMLIVAALGLVVNLVSMRLLSAGKDASLNVKGAYLEVWADMLGSVGVIVAALAIRFTGWSWIDPAVAVAIGLWVLPRTWTLLRDTTNILLQGVPRGLSLPDLRAAIADVPGVGGVHDLHVWSLSSNDITCTAHVELADDVRPEQVRGDVEHVLRSRFDIVHSTIQIEERACGEESTHR